MKRLLHLLLPAAAVAVFSVAAPAHADRYSLSFSSHGFYFGYHDGHGYKHRYKRRHGYTRPYWRGHPRRYWRHPGVRHYHYQYYGHPRRYWKPHRPFVKRHYRKHRRHYRHRDW